MNTPKKGDPDYVDYVLRMSQRGVLRQGIINEPRAYYDEIVVNPLGTETNGSPGVFVNGEEFPVRLTHMTAAIRFLNTATPQTLADPQMIQQIGLRMTFHNEFYMNPTFLPLPIWGNKTVALPAQIDSACSAWDFVANGQPFVLSARDTLQVQVQLRDLVAPATAVPVTVAFTGFGMLSKRPYILNSRIELTDIAPITMDTIDFRNDGTEPIVITDMMVNVAAEEGATPPRGNIDRVSLNVRQVGNGTNGDWFRGPTNPVAINRMQATLAGLTSGRAIVHQFPGDGIIWEPAEGITLAAMNLDVLPVPANFNVVLVLAFLGYIMVT